MMLGGRRRGPRAAAAAARSAPAAARPPGAQRRAPGSGGARLWKPARAKRSSAARRGREQRLALHAVVAGPALRVGEHRVEQRLLEALRRGSPRPRTASPRWRGRRPACSSSTRPSAARPGGRSPVSARRSSPLPPRRTRRGSPRAARPCQCSDSSSSSGAQLARRDLSERARPHSAAVSSPRPGNAAGASASCADRPRNSSPARYRGASAGAASRRARRTDAHLRDQGRPGSATSRSRMAPASKAAGAHVRQPVAERSSSTTGRGFAPVSAP